MYTGANRLEGCIRGLIDYAIDRSTEIIKRIAKSELHEYIVCIDSMTTLKRLGPEAHGEVLSQKNRWLYPWCDDYHE